MADDKDQNGKDDFDSLDEEFELDLFGDEEDQVDPATDDDAPTASEVEFENEFDDELDKSLDDEFADTLDDDVIELSDEDVAAEFAAMEREESGDASDSRSEPEISDLTLPDDEDEIETDNVYQNISKEEFGAPDQYPEEPGSKTSNSAQATPGKSESKLPTIALPPFLASLTTLSPRMVVAATAAALLPLVIFAVLGLNSDSSDADETAANNAVDDPFVAADDNAESAAPANTVNVPNLDEDELLTAANTSDETTEDLAENSASTDIANNELTTPAAEPSASPSLDNALQAMAELEEENLMLAQVDDSQQQPEVSTVEPMLVVPPETSNNQEEPAEEVEAEAEETETETVSNSRGIARQAIVEDPTPAADAAVSNNSANSNTDNRNYHIIVASFATEATANRHAEQISDGEISAYVIPPFGNASNYRVAVASYRTLAEARENIPGLRAVYGSGIWPLRYPPATGVPLINSQTGNVFIIVASFPNEQLARTHADGLVQRGEQPAIIAPYPPANRYRVAVSQYDDAGNAQNALPQFRQNYGADAWLLRY